MYWCAHKTATLTSIQHTVHGRHEKCPTHNYVPALWLITPLVCHFCVQKEKIEKKKKSFPNTNTVPRS